MADFTIAQGTDGGFTWPLFDQRTKKPLNLTGYKARAQMRVRNDRLIYTWSSDLGNLIIANNEITILWNSGITSGWKIKDARYDLEIISPDGRVARADSGSITVSRERTR